MHETSYKRMSTLVDRYLGTFFGQCLSIADVGSANICGTYKPLFTGEGKEHWMYWGLDLEPGDNVDVIIPAEGPWNPRMAESFDVVISGQMLEHCWKPWVTIKEMAAVLKPGGLMCLIAPCAWPYHAFPTDNWRFWPEGFRALFDEAGLKPVFLEADMAPVLEGDCVGVARKP